MYGYEVCVRWPGGNPPRFLVGTRTRFANGRAGIRLVFYFILRGTFRTFPRTVFLFFFFLFSCPPTTNTTPPPHTCTLTTSPAHLPPALSLPDFQGKLALCTAINCCTGLSFLGESEVCCECHIVAGCHTTAAAWLLRKPSSQLLPDQSTKYNRGLFAGLLLSALCTFGAMTLPKKRVFLEGHRSP